MVIIRLMGGLGNQMFQYAAGRSFQSENGGELKLDLNGYKYQFGTTPRKFELAIFNLDYMCASLWDITRLVGFNIINRVFIRMGVNLNSRSIRYIKEKSFAYDSSVEALGKYVYLDGFWQSEKYFIDCENEIRNLYTFKNKLFGKNEYISKWIRNTNSVSLHIRRGDYVDNEIVNKFHGTCGLDYYKQAMGVIDKKVKKPKYFVFSDDIEWVKDNLKIKNAVYVEGNIGSKSNIDMQLMSLCKHNIIANSSFSWWGAWLNNNKNKIVIAPKKWFNDPSINTKDLIPKKWLRI